uniref:Peroxisomal membrane protein 2 n=1 Tax=Fibrocapsa japonica TaxID=94617 RepID=A0A7S2XVN5_9STRA|eukprot:CAMPEP_0113944148 /NCGR_PEP_ID=MMETSP1339-20121228/30668_1 /TAXON_ID=94617 /ORGANISM="Fibrocapsa japonica" /LENGTH=247 /DNA_ID=CAMNT_0000949231 /DNA_START=84 /DNA_END=827 /DNA_ORIENTATION=- /assembly_acc=CAM_ASM_000762
MTRPLLFLCLSACLAVVNGFSSVPNLAISQHSYGEAKKTTTPRMMADISGVSSLWDSYLAALESQPLITKSITAAAILPAADFSAQLLEKQKETDEKSIDSKESDGIDAARVLRFSIFGLLLQAPWNHFYYLYLDSAIPPTEDAFTTTTAVKVFIDQFVQAPVFTVLIFVALGLLEGKALSSIRTQLKDDYWSTLQANWKLWVPAATFNLAFCPPQLRVLFTNLVFFFWSIFISLVVNKEKTEEQSS